MQRGDDERIELPSALALDLVDRGIDRNRPPVGAIGRQGVERVGDQDQPRAERDLGARRGRPGSRRRPSARDDAGRSSPRARRRGRAAARTRSSDAVPRAGARPRSAAPACSGFRRAARSCRRRGATLRGERARAPHPRRRAAGRGRRSALRPPANAGCSTSSSGREPRRTPFGESGPCSMAAAAETASTRVTRR